MELVKPVLTVENAAQLFTRASDVPVSDADSWLIYGGAKEGKTWVAGTAGDRNLFISIGNGHKTIQSPAFKKLVGANPILKIIRENLDKFGCCLQPTAFDEVSLYIDYALENFADEFDYVTVDDGTALSRFALFKGMKDNWDRGQKSKSWAVMRDNHVISPVVQDYGAEMNMIYQFIYGTISLCKQHNKQFILTAHTRETWIKRQGAQIGEQKELKSITPAFTGETFPDVVQGAFDNVIKMEAVGGGTNTVYRPLTAGDEKVVAGMRNAGIFETVERNPNIARFAERIRKNELHSSYRSK